MAPGGKKGEPAETSACGAPEEPLAWAENEGLLAEGGSCDGGSRKSFRARRTVDRSALLITLR
jgi:hypothetical protein